MHLTELETWYLWLMIYSFCGWVYECIICSVGHKKLINRGFLNGPYCPIYGSGAVLILLVLGRLKSPAALFFLGALLTCSLEYFTSWLMEKLFHARWWDYSKRFGNLNGRVCLLGATVFGLFSMVLVLWIHPAVKSLTDRIPQPALHWIAGLLLAAFVSDYVVTLRGMQGTSGVFAEYETILRQRRAELEARLKESPAYAALRQRQEAAADRLKELPGYEALQEDYMALHSRLNFQQRRMLRSFPELRLTEHNEVLTGLRHALERARGHVEKHMPETVKDKK